MTFKFIKQLTFKPKYKNYLLSENANNFNQEL